MKDDASTSSHSSSSAASSSFDSEDENLPFSLIGSKILADEDLIDVHLVGIDGVKIGANRTILGVRSQVFKRMLFGNFQEAISSNVKLGYKGEILKAVVEYIHTNSAPQMLSTTTTITSAKDRFHSLLMLKAAADFFVLPGLAKKITTTIHEILKEENPSLSFALLEACGDSTTTTATTLEGEQQQQQPTIFQQQAELAIIALSKINKYNDCGITHDDFLNYMSDNSSIVGCLSESVVEEILQNHDKLYMTELDIFNFLHVWAKAGVIEAGPNSTTASDDQISIKKEKISTTNPSEYRISTAQDLSKYIAFEKIIPTKLDTTVRSSGLVTINQLAEAFKEQAVTLTTEGNSDKRKACRDAFYEYRSNY